jgi:U3 small nucleolar RNA-associated protein 4
VIIPMKSLGNEYQYKISGLPQYPPVSSSTVASVFASWWGNEVRIWKLGDSPSGGSHRLVARIVIKGDENICDAALSLDGTLLAVLSAAGLRIFRLSLENPPHGSTVKRIASVTGLGGKLAKFSPDSKWLAIISHSNRVKLFSTRQDFQGRLISESFIEVNRINRDADVRLHGSLGKYWRNINRLAFSPDSKMLVVSDISGYLDCWMLGTASTSLPINGKPKSQSTDSAEEDNDNDDDDMSELSDVGVQIDGWEWKRGAAARDLPQLDSAPIVLSFRPQTGIEDGYQLLAITSRHNIFELSLSAGSFTDWSRRNPTQVLPKKFQETKDRAMGSFWGSNGWWWIYGAGWLFGIDVTVDHNADESSEIGPEGRNSKKRKRNEGGSGAGDAVKRKDQYGLVRPEGHDDGRESGRDPVPTDDEDSGDEDDAPFTRPVDDVRASHTSQKERSKWFMTFKYRPILGIVPVAEEEGQPVQVALIERPVWDLDLPPRFESIHQAN